jgi:hypothetical protein
MKRLNQNQEKWMGLSGKAPDDSGGLLAGKSQGEIMELIGGRFGAAPARPNGAAESLAVYYVVFSLT